jgi:hypothetical protein
MSQSIDEDQRQDLGVVLISRNEPLIEIAGSRCKLA